MNVMRSLRWPLSWQATLALLLAGALQALSLAWPFASSFLGVPQGEAHGTWQCAALAVLAWHLNRSTSTRLAFASAWTFALAWLVGSMWWLYISMHTYGGMHGALAALAVLSLAAALAIFYALAGALFVWVCRQGRVGAWGRMSAFAATWVLAEWARGTWWTGFPWGAVGYAHVDSALRHWAPWVGVYGLCAVAAFLAMGLALLVQRVSMRPSHRAGAFVLLVWLAGMGWMWWTSPSRTPFAEPASPKPLSVTLLQGNVAQDLKFSSGVSQALRDYREALLSSTSELTVTPETALPLTLAQLPPGYWDALQTHFSHGTQAALIGLPLARVDDQGRWQYSNAALGLVPAPFSTTANTPPEPLAQAAFGYQYAKHHLVPFGEFVPPLFQWFVRLLNIPLGSFARGALVQPNLLFKGERIAPNICYEDLFGEELAQRFADPATAPTLMVNLSNIAWFGDTVAIDQHLHISRLRALELARPMLRATNTGATAIINAQGVVTHRLPSAVQGALTAEVQGVHGPVTPYARWVSAWGLWPLVVLALLTLGIVAATAKRRGA